MKKRMICAAIAAAVVSTGMPVTVLAQQALEEIIVTSQRRSEDLQSVPIAVTAFTPAELDRLGVSDPQAMADYVPNVSIGDGTGRANVGAQFSIRGINEARISPVLDPAVGIYIDDVYYGRPITNFLRLLDVQSVEVLRGPQGTLFGKNSTGGAIRYQTVRPDVDAGTTGYVKLGLGEFDRVDVRAAVNLSLSETVAARFSMASMERDGYLERLSDGVAVGADNTDFYSAKLRFVPSDALTIDVGVDYTEATSNGGASKLIDYFGYNGGYDNPATPGIEGDTTAGFHTPGISNVASYNILFPVGTPEHYAPVLPSSLYQIAGTGPIGGTQSESTGITLDVAYDISDTMSLRSLTGYRTVETVENRESDESVFTQSYFDGITVDDISFWSQEFQLNGSLGDGFVNYVAGVYYSEEKPEQSEKNVKDYRAVEAFGVQESNRQAMQETTSTGVYFQADWQLLDTLTLTTGVRYTEDEKSFAVFDNIVWDEALYQRLVAIHGGSNVNLNPAGPARSLDSHTDRATYLNCTRANPCAGATVSGGDTFSSTTPRVALEWQATDDAMFYIASSAGFKAGGTNDTVDDINTPFQPEEVISNEVGTRLTLLDGRLRANVTYFDMDYTDKQLTVTTSPICARRCTTNVGDASISGLEIEAIALLTDSLRLNLGYGSLDAEWSDIQNASAGVENDSPFSRAPDTSFTAGLQHTLTLNSGAALVSSVNYAYKSEQESSGQDSTTLTIPEYELYTARLAYQPSDANWEISLFCSNCLDEEYITGGAAWAGSTDGSGFDYKPTSHPAFNGTTTVSTTANAPPGITLVNIGAPRMMGLDFSYRF